MIILETSRLIVRTFEKNDFIYFISLHQDKETMRYFASGVKSNSLAKKTLDYIIDHQNKYGFSYWIVFDKNNNFIGQAGIVNNFNGTVNLCFAIYKNQRRKGYAFEVLSAIVDYAIKNINNIKISAIAMPENLASNNLLKKLNFKYIKDSVVDGFLVFYYLLDR